MTATHTSPRSALPLRFAAAMAAMAAMAGIAPAQDSAPATASAPASTQAASEPATASAPVAEENGRDARSTHGQDARATTEAASESASSEPAATQAATSQAASLPAATVLGSDELASEIPRVWRQVRMAPAGPELRAALADLARLLKALPEGARLDIALTLLDEQAETPANQAAWEAMTAAWGPEWIHVDDLRRMLLGGSFPATTSVPESIRAAQSARLLLRIVYERMCEGSRAQTQPIAPSPRQEEMVKLLLGYLAALGTLSTAASSPANKAISEGDQRLLMHLLESAVTCSRQWEREGLRGQLWQTLTPSRSLEHTAPMLAQAMEGWAAIGRCPQEPTEGVAAAMLYLGHWNSTVRLRAAAFLSRQMNLEQARMARSAPKPNQLMIAQRLQSLLADDRDAIRAAAAMAFGMSTAPGPKDLGSALARMLLADPAAPVQQAAAAALRARADLGKGAIDLLLDRLAAKVERRRAQYILQTLASLVPQASPAQARRMTDLAMDRLPRVPRGAMDLLAALGNQRLLTDLARTAALAAVREHLASADRLERQWIERHVLPALRRLASTRPGTRGEGVPPSRPAGILPAVLPLSFDLMGETPVLLAGETPAPH